ncbi:multicopper oxidase domain-containing protein [Mycobacterium koreense]|uniref:Copper-containing nitrite reductase n=1 Tax=Mycolicibacillus koreensis TaxID=1069220 RepID=A0A7I7SG70_9MYCO|nr:multicopper oxidase domain-containing protein [Mycolicibacillus koreensis]MCV7248579.1 multicopper oxidase domain-containing protein [Mycolicibacillus koreensis]OSC29402.1 copper oxidase [Mycolicibacillus koreensis]BBY55540.1 hypothetical protein MKOR_27910 [Mycolicibacillus koreensis]
MIQVAASGSKKPPLIKPGKPGGPRRPVFVIGNVVVLAWLAIAVALLLSYNTLNQSVWLPIHALLLGAATTAILIWSEHFAATLCRAPDPPSWQLTTKLAVLNVAAITALAGVYTGVMVLTAAAGVAVAVVAVVHAAHLVAMRRAALQARFDYLISFYVASGGALLLGAGAGAALALGADGWYARLWSTHVHVMLYGWIGLTVVGTLFTLWPVASGVRITEHSIKLARRTLPTLVAGLTAVVAGVLVENVWLAGAGLVGYAAGVVIAVVALWPSRKPREIASWNLAAAMGWLAVAVLIEMVGAAWSRSVEVLPGLVESVVMPMLVVGFVAQILIGALTQMLPVVVAQGPAERKAVVSYLEQGWQARLAVLNLAVPLVAAHWPGPVRMVGWALAAIGVATFVGLALRLAVPAMLRRRMNVEAIERRLPGTMTGLVAGLSAVVVAIAASVGPSLSSTEEPVPAAAEVIDVALHDMRVWPNSVEVPAGTHLVLRVTNDESLPHDLRADSGEHTPRLRRGETAMLDIGVVNHDRDIWCDVPGHKAAGMTMTVIAVGGQAKPADEHSAHHGDADAQTPQLNLAADPSPGWTPRDATLPAAKPGLHRVELRATDEQLEVAPGRRENRWTFGGTEPSPTLHGKVGDRFEITLINDTTMGHGIDFHAGALSPDQPMRTLQPGEKLVYRFTANRAGAWLYHCSTDPISLHIANGMYGAVIIDPPGLSPVDHEFAMVGAQLYLGDPDSDDKPTAIRADRPDGWMLNGMADQYRHAPLQVRAGERVRIWLVNAGPGDTIAFHIVGTQFDTVYKEGAWLLRPDAASTSQGGSQVLDLAPAQGGFVELTFPEPGHYMIMDHDLRHAEGGARGTVAVTG